MSITEEQLKILQSALSNQFVVPKLKDAIDAILSEYLSYDAMKMEQSHEAQRPPNEKTDILADWRQLLDDIYGAIGDDNKTDTPDTKQEDVNQVKPDRVKTLFDVVGEVRAYPDQRDYIFICRYNDV